MKKEISASLKDFVLNDKFWNILRFLDSVEKELPVRLIFEEYKCNKSELKDVINFLSFFKYDFSIEKKEGDEFLVPPQNKEKIQFEMGLSEWLAFQTQFPVLSSFEDSIPGQILSEKLSVIESAYPQFDLFHYLMNKDERASMLEGNESLAQTVECIESAIIEGSVVAVKLKNQNEIQVYPQKVVFLEGVLCLVGEELLDRCLVSFQVDDIESFEIPIKKKYIPNFSGIEIDDFINALRAVSGNEQRLVLKILNPDNVNLSPDYHYLGNPYLTTNPNGDVIWAASIEVSDDLFEWIYQMGDNVEILDPSSFRLQFEEYCHDIEQSNSLKKAS